MRHNLSHFVSLFGIILGGSVSSVGTNKLYWVCQISSIYMEVNNSLFPQQFVSFWLYLYSEIKGPQITLHPESFMEMGFDTALQIFFGFFSTWRRKSPKQTFIWHCKVENNSYSPLKGSGAFPAYGDATLSGTRNYSCSILFKTKTGKTKQKNLPPVCNKLLILGSFWCI